MLAYGWTLGRYFTGEDFLILGRLLSADGPAWVADSFSGPWLGIELVQFYRPVATLLLGLEAWLFGAQSLPYNLVHLLVHVVNTLLFFHWLRIGPLSPVQDRDSQDQDSTSTQLAGSAALLFALYPLHPNTVTFIASFATLFAATFALLALLAYERGKSGWTVVAYGLALGCYEGVAVLPALLLVRDMLQRWSGVTSLRPRVWVHLHIATFSLLGAYFLLRRKIFGVTLGGYAHMSERLRWPWPWLGDLSTSFQRLVYPSYEQAAGTATTTVPAITAAVLLALFALIVVAWRSNGVAQRRGAAALTLGLLWIVIAQAPFSFVPVVPGNGRYWYVAVMGLALAVCSLADLVARQLPTRGNRRDVSQVRARWWVATTVALLLVCWLPILGRDLGRYLEAGRLARQLQSDVVRLAGHGTGDAPQAPLFLFNYPQWLSSAGGAPVAKVFHWGLHDALRPPFVAAEHLIYPLPAPEAAPCAGDLDSARALRSTDLGVLRWTKAGLERLPPLSLSVGPPLPGLSPPGQPAPDAEAQRRLLVVIAAGNVRCRALPAQRDPVSQPEPPLPADFLRAMHMLYAAPIYWWVETRTADGRWLGSTPPRALSPEQVARQLAALP